MRIIVDLPEGFELSNTLPSAIVSRRRESERKTIVAGEAYYAEKDKLILVEHTLLRSINFDVVLPHPHRELLLLCRDLEVDVSTTAIAVRLLNDALTFTDLVLQYETTAIVASVLHTAFVLSDCTNTAEKRKNDGRKWFEKVGFSAEVVESLGHVLIDMLVEMDRLFG